jgi:hypothetical protein
MMHDRAEGEVLAYTHEFLSHMLGANRKSVTLAAQSMQAAGLISYRRGKIQILDRPGLEKASCECYAIVRERFDAFLTPPTTAVQYQRAKEEWKTREAVGHASHACRRKKRQPMPPGANSTTERNNGAAQGRLASRPHRCRLARFQLRLSKPSPF